jgi:hypothetical protein
MLCKLKIFSIGLVDRLRSRTKNDLDGRIRILINNPHSGSTTLLNHKHQNCLDILSKYHFMLKDYAKRDTCKGEVNPLLSGNHKTGTGTGYVLSERGSIIHETAFYKEKLEGNFRLPPCFIVQSSNIE